MQGPPDSEHPPHPGYPFPLHAAWPPPAAGHYVSYSDDGIRRRKPVRAAQACDSCRKRKVKCDEARPECQHCEENHLTCSYREKPPQKSEEPVPAITRRLEGLSDNVTQLMQTQKAQDEKIERLLNLQSALLPDVQTLSQRHGHTDSVEPSSHIRLAPVQYKSEDSQVIVAPQNTNPSFSSDGEEVQEGGQPFEYSMPPKHTTAVHNLMDWPSVRALIPQNQSTTYVMDAECHRGLLRLYGCSEDEDKGNEHEAAPSPGVSSSSQGHRTDDDTASSSPRSVWSDRQLPSQPFSTEHYTARGNSRVLRPNIGLILDSSSIDKYFRIYMDSMHILHPFLAPKVIRTMVNMFKESYSWDMKVPRVTLGTKRKRDAIDPLSTFDETTTSNQANCSQLNQQPTNVAIEHTVANAVVLLVLALGRECAHRESLPGAASSISIRNSHPSHQSVDNFPLKTATSIPTSPLGASMELNEGTRKILVSSPANPQGDNMNVIPGLAYFAKAADILGELPGGVDISHIQANLLAGLYMGRLARILPSHYYISVASRACQILIESTEYKEGGKDSDKMSRPQRNLINFAFWSCLQLESDILAEVDLPPSGITRYEGCQYQEMPTGITLDNIPEYTDHADILRFYSYQVQLRRTMNDIHSMLYRKKKGTSERPTNVLLDILNDNLENWRKMLGDWDWDDDNYESPNINMARMRAKYYGAKYIIHRPILQYLLRNSSFQTASIKHSDSPHVQADSSSLSLVQHGGSRSSLGQRLDEILSPGRNAYSSLERDLIPYAQKCVKAAIRSTTAFDSVPSRLIVTNIFGTAHA